MDRTYVCISHLHPPSLSLCSKFGWCDPAPGPFNQQFDRAYVCPSVCLSDFVGALLYMQNFSKNVYFFGKTFRCVNQGALALSVCPFKNRRRFQKFPFFFHFLFCSKLYAFLNVYFCVFPSFSNTFFMSFLGVSFVRVKRMNVGETVIALHWGDTRYRNANVI